MTSPFSIRLKPKSDARSIRHGMPWIYGNDLVMDRRTRALEPGCLAVLQDNAREDLALVAVNPGSKLVVRVLDLDASTQIDRTWFATRIERALKLRERLFGTPFYRLIHAEADGLPGVIIDRFDDMAVIQPNAAWAEAHLDLLVAALIDVTQVRHVVKNASSRARGLEGLDDQSAVLAGQTPDAPIEVQMNDAIYLADLMGGQKTGLYYDQRENHRFAATLAQGARVLDVFSHVGGFSLAALAAGATSALAVDGSEPALRLAADGAVAMGKADQFSTRKGDAFQVMETLRDEGKKFDLVICDPPAFAPSKSALGQGLRAYERVARLAADLVDTGGVLGLCSCSGAATVEKFRNASIRGIGRAGRQGRLIYQGAQAPDHPLHPQLSDSGYLKAHFYAL